MSNLETALLDALLDRYERSRGFKENRGQRRRVQLQMYGGGKTDFPAYDIEDSPARMAVNEAARRLAGQGVAELEWMRGCSRRRAPNGCAGIWRTSWLFF